MKKKYLYGLIIIIIIILAGTTVWGWMRYQNLQKQVAEKQVLEESLQDLEDQFSKTEDSSKTTEDREEQKSDKKTRDTEFSYTHATYDTTYEELSFEGIVEPETTHYVLPKIPGRADKIFVEEGDKVEEGETLLELETDELDFKLTQAEAAVKAAESQLEMAQKGARDKEIEQLDEQIKQAEVNLDLVKTTYERTKELYEDNIVPKQEYDEVKTKKEEVESKLNSAKKELEKAREGARQEEIKAAKAKLEQARADLEIVKLNIDDSTVEAQADGIIARREVEEGALVSDQEPSFILIEINPVVVVVETSEKDMVQINKGDKADVSIEAFPEREFKGTISKISPMADSDKRVFEVEVEIDNPDHDIKPGMYANLDLKSTRETESLVIPSSAIRNDSDDEEIVYIIEDDIVYSQPVETGSHRGTMIEIKSGLEEGDPVITNPTDELVPGMEVEAEEVEL